MLSKETFIAGMTALKKGYIGWEFDLGDDMQISFWYAAFKGLSDEQFNSMIGEYYAHNHFPPKCARDLTEVLVDAVVAKAKIKPDNALDTVREIVSNCGGWDYEGRDEIYQELKKYPALSDTVHEFEAELRRMNAGDTYTADRFRRAYEIKLRANAIRQVDKALGLSIPDNSKLLGSGFLPSEI